MRNWIIIAISLVFFSSTLIAGRRSPFQEVAKGDGIRRVDAEFKLATGRFDCSGTKTSGDTVAQFDGKYDSDLYKHDFEFSPRGETADLFFESKLRKKSISDIDSKDNVWGLSLSEDVEWNLDLDAGAAQIDFDFARMAVSELDLEVGAADAELDFSTPNKIAMSRCKISAGACQLKLKDFGNARFERLVFEGGVGSFLIDFSGDFDYEADAKIDVGLGSVDIIVPEEIGLRLEADENWFNSIDFSRRQLHRVSRHANVYETENFDSAKGKLTILLNVGMGSANIKFR